MVAFSDVSALQKVADASQVIQEAARESVALQAGNVVTMEAGVLRQPLVSVLPTAGWESGELGTATRRKNVSPWAATQQELVAAPLATIIVVPEEAIEDQRYDIWEAMRPGISTAFARALDAAVLFGTAKPAVWTSAAVVPGATAAGNTVSVATTTDIAAAINLSFQQVENDGYNVNGVASRRSLRSQLRGLRDSDGSPIYTQSLASAPGSIATVYDSPLYSVNNGAWDASAAEAITGDWRNLYIGIRRDMTFKVIDQGTIYDGTNTYYLAQEDAVALRVSFRVAFAVFDPANPEASNGYPFSVVTA